VSNSDLTAILFVLLPSSSAISSVQLRQPKVIAEILAGIVLGPALLPRLRFISLIATATYRGYILDFVYWLGLLSLMFLCRGGNATAIHP
jgi:Kef-type K+ transport system membrane component KefB